jgi:hypothetical protein
MVVSAELNAITQRYERAAARQTALAFLRDREAELRQLREEMRFACQPLEEVIAFGSGPETQRLWPPPQTAPRSQEQHFIPYR